MKKLLCLLIYIITITSNAQEDDIKIIQNPWNLDYLEDYVSIYTFRILNSEKEFTNKTYSIKNNASASGEVKGNINLVKHILPKEKTFDVSNFKFLNFTITNNEAVEIVIMQDEDRPWENRLRYTVPSNLLEKTYAIPFSDFLDSQGKKVAISNIKTIVFSIIGDYTNYIPFHLEINELSFNKINVLADNSFKNIERTKLKNYPNPFSGSTTIQLTSESQNIQIRVFDYLGRVVDYQRINVKGSSDKVRYSAPQLNKGIYKYSIKDDNSKMHSGTFIVN